MIDDFVFLSIGLVCAALGGELFVRGLVGIASWIRVPAAVIGATVAAFATSSPELTVAINAAADDRPEIALGDALGSNLVNIGLVVGLLLLAGTSLTADLSRRDAWTGLGLTVTVGFLILDGEIARSEGFVLLFCFGVWISLLVRQSVEARDHEDDNIAVETIGERRHGRSVLVSLVGLAFLIAAGRLLVIGAKGLGAELGLSTFVVGVVFVSLGTSLPELATVIAAKIRGHAELGFGTVLGSNIFNVSFIVGVAAVLTPIDVDRGDVAISLLFGAAMLPVLLWRSRTTSFSRRRGVILLGMYGGALATLLVLQA